MSRNVHASNLRTRLPLLCYFFGEGVCSHPNWEVMPLAPEHWDCPPCKSQLPEGPARRGPGGDRGYLVDLTILAGPVPRCVDAIAVARGPPCLWSLSPTLCRRGGGRVRIAGGLWLAVTGGGGGCCSPSPKSTLIAPLSRGAKK